MGSDHLAIHQNDILHTNELLWLATCLKGCFSCVTEVASRPILP